MESLKSWIQKIELKKNLIFQGDSNEIRSDKNSVGFDEVEKQ